MLLLFDIDGTLLLRAADAHRDAIYEALRVVHGVTEPDRRGMEVAGRTDADISRSLLVHAGVSADQIDARADDVRVAACAAYGRSFTWAASAAQFASALSPLRPQQPAPDHEAARSAEPRSRPSAQPAEGAPQLSL